MQEFSAADVSLSAYEDATAFAAVHFIRQSEVREFRARQAIGRGLFGECRREDLVGDESDGSDDRVQQGTLYARL